MTKLEALDLELFVRQLALFRALLVSTGLGKPHLFTNTLRRTHRN